MRKANRTRAGSRSNRRPPGRGAGRGSGSVRRPSRRRSAGKNRLSRFKILAILLLIAGIGSIAFTIHYYSRFNRLMDAFLNEPPPRAAVYATPLILRQGQFYDGNELERILRRSGYGSGTGSRPGWFERTEGTFRIGEDPGDRARATGIQLAGGRIQSIQTGGHRTARAQLRPPYLSPLFGHNREKRKTLSFEDLPDNLVHALLAAEDEDFFQHSGISIRGILRATFNNLRNWSRQQGGSTITQQFVKNYFLTPDKSFRRKFEELFFAVFLERRFSKKEILELYANEVYLGQLGSFAIHGFGQGAEAYFGKHVGELRLSECAALAGIIQAPNRYSPHRSPDAVIQRRNYVLDEMEAESFITARDNALARREPLEIRPEEGLDYSEAPYFVDYLRTVLAREFGIDPAQRQVSAYSTLDLDLQRAAFLAVQEGLQEVEELVEARKDPPLAQAALIAVEPRTGEILALIGGRDYATGQYNRATLALRQPGSSFKPFVYAAALQSRVSGINTPLTLASQLLDEPHTFTFDDRDYSPGNFGGEYHGIVSVRQALAQSLNVPTIKIGERVGFANVQRYAQAFGFNDRIQPYPSIALGTFEVSLLELVQAYQALANQGRLIPLQSLQKLEIDGVDQELPQHLAGGSPVVTREVAFLVTSALESTLEQGTGRSIRKLGFALPAAGKTGSTHDSWFVGYTPELLCGVWVGTDQPPNLDLTGAAAALRIWTYFMQKAEALGRLSGKEFPIPAGIASVRIDIHSGLVAQPGCSETRIEYFIKGTEPVAPCKDHQPLSGPDLDRVEKKKGGHWNWLTRIFKR